MSRRSNSRPSRAVVARRKKAAGLLALLAVLAVIWGRNALDALPRPVRASSTTEVSIEGDEQTLAATRPPLHLARPTGGLRDPFSIDDAAYSKRPSAPDPEPLPEPEPIASGQPEPEVAPPPDAGGLRLQGTFLGAEPKAMINGRTLRVGDAIDGFRLRTISNRRVVVVKDGFTFELDL